VGALALQVARKLLGRLPEDTLLAALADTAARETLTAPPLALVVHPDRVDAVRAQLATFARDGDDAALRCEVRADAACAPDTCRLETEHGTVDASLEAQLARLAQAWGIET
jgi:flagellar biosynthesis/type III secretory pathway protein FliH